MNFLLDKKIKQYIIKLSISKRRDFLRGSVSNILFFCFLRTYNSTENPCSVLIQISS